MFNSLKYAKMLEKVGVSRDQAETQIEIMTEIVETNLATKQDLKDLMTMVTQEFALLRSEVKQVEYRMTIKLGSVMTIIAGLAVAFLKFA